MRLNVCKKQKHILEVWILIKQGEFKIFRIILVFPAVDLIWYFKKKNLKVRESFFK